VLEIVSDVGDKPEDVRLWLGLVGIEPREQGCNVRTEKRVVQVSEEFPPYVRSSSAALPGMRCTE
jgi:hypothetical protein